MADPSPRPVPVANAGYSVFCRTTTNWARPVQLQPIANARSAPTKICHRRRTRGQMKPAPPSDMSTKINVGADLCEGGQLRLTEGCLRIGYRRAKNCSAASGGELSRLWTGGPDFSFEGISIPVVLRTRRETMRQLWVYINLAFPAGINFEKTGFWQAAAPALPPPLVATAFLRAPFGLQSSPTRARALSGTGTSSWSSSRVQPKVSRTVTPSGPVRNTALSV